MLVADLFSCVGGHALGYMRAGFEPGFFCEVRPERIDVLRKQFPSIPVVRGVENVRFAIGEIVIGGPACQRTSVAAAIHGYRSGDSLWPQYRKVIGDGSFEWAIIEQPPGNKDWENTVSRDLATDGWACQWHTITASELGYPHIRRRRFAIANRNLSRLQSAGDALPSAIESVKRAASARRAWIQSIPRVMRMVDGVSRGVDRQQRIEAIGDSNPPEMAEAIFLAIKGATP